MRRNFTENAALALGIVGAVIVLIGQHYGVIAMSTHTPGPWEIVKGDEWTTDIGTPEPDYEDGRKRHWTVASVNKRRDEWEANRRLIAAAPELLSVAYSVLNAAERIDYDPDSSFGMLVAQADAAIDKATGETA